MEIAPLHLLYSRLFLNLAINLQLAEKIIMLGYVHYIVWFLPQAERARLLDLDGLS